MITQQLITGTTATVPTQVFLASAESAITTMIFCNTLTPNSSREADNSILVNVYIVTSGASGSYVAGQPGALIVSKLLVPAGESVIFSDERIILSTGDSVQVGYEYTSEHLAVSPALSTPSYSLTVTVSSLLV
jgi:hypothetical protein